jgi:hypothetical protein
VHSKSKGGGTTQNPSMNQFARSNFHINAMDYDVNIDLYVIKRKHVIPNCIKLLHVKLFQEVDVEGSISATIYFECIAIRWKSYC